MLGIAGSEEIDSKAAAAAAEDDEACFVDPPFSSVSSKNDFRCSPTDLSEDQIESQAGQGSTLRIDYLTRLPIELALYVLLSIGDDRQTLVSCRLVSKGWRSLAEDPVVWREMFKDRTCWRVKREFKPTPTQALGQCLSLTTSDRQASQWRRPTLRMRDIVEEEEEENGRGEIVDEGESTSKNDLQTKVRGLIEHSLINEDLPQSPLPVLSRQNSIESYRTNGSGNIQIARRLSKLLGDTMANPPFYSSNSLSSSSSPSLLDNLNGQIPNFGNYAVSSSLDLGEASTAVDPLTPVMVNDKLISPLDVAPLSYPPSSLSNITSMDDFTMTQNQQQFSTNFLNTHQAIYESKEDMSLDWFQLYRDRAVLDNRWKDGKQKPSSLKGHTDSIYCVQFNGDQMLITGSRDRTIKLWDLGTGECTETLRGHQGSVLCLRVDGSRIISGSSDCRIIQWAPKTCEVSQKNISYEVETEFIGHGSGVLDLAMNEKVIISCSKDMTIKVWDRLSNKLIRTITGHHGPVNALQLLAAQFPASSDASKGSSENNPTTTRFISASGDSSMKLWELETGKCLRVFEGHLRGLACVKLVEELGLVISGSKDENIKIWDLNTGRCMKTLIGHEGLVRTLDVDVAQKRLVTGSYDKTIKVWDLSEGSLILDFRKQGNRFKSLVFDLKINCNKIVSVGHDSSIVVLNFGYGIDCENFI